MELETLLEYLTDTYKFEGDAKVLKFDKDQKGNFLVLEKTIFYAQGGGQPCDIGTINLNDHTFEITFVSFNNGVVQHYFKESESVMHKLNDFIGQTCVLRIDSSRRLNNAKSHTSGHLLASVVEMLDENLIGIKGYHFPEGPYVEFKGKLTSLSSEELINKANKIMNEKINAKANVSATEVGQDEINNNNNLSKSPEFQLQPGKKARFVQIEGFGPVPCGGTHLKNLSELKEISIRKINSSKGNTRVAYAYS
jgi:Ser-tRNA(Ala) deacylase AlaX